MCSFPEYILSSPVQPSPPPPPHPIPPHTLEQARCKHNALLTSEYGAKSGHATNGLSVTFGRVHPLMEGLLDIEIGTQQMER